MLWRGSAGLSTGGPHRVVGLACRGCSSGLISVRVDHVHTDDLVVDDFGEQESLAAVSVSGRAGDAGQPARPGQTRHRGFKCLYGRSGRARDARGRADFRR